MYLDLSIYLSIYRSIYLSIHRYTDQAVSGIYNSLLVVSVKWSTYTVHAALFRLQSRVVVLFLGGGGGGVCAEAKRRV